MSKADEIRKKYIDNPPEGYSRNYIKNLPDEELLDMDYFLNEDIEDIFNATEDNYFGVNPSEFSDCIDFKCQKCGTTQKLPKQIAENLIADFGSAPKFLQLPCNKRKCNGFITPVNYTASNGITYKI